MILLVNATIWELEGMQFRSPVIVLLCITQCYGKRDIKNVCIRRIRSQWLSVHFTRGHFGMNFSCWFLTWLIAVPMFWITHLARKLKSGLWHATAVCGPYIGSPERSNATMACYDKRWPHLGICVKSIWVALFPSYNQVSSNRREHELTCSDL